MTDLRIEQVDGDAMLRDWQHVHNVVIPTAVLSLDEVRERVERYRLDVAYLGDVLVGCSTVRPSPADPDSPPAPDLSAATVIARVLPAHRGQGFGQKLYTQGMAYARTLGADVVETVVLESNADGLRFAQARGFVEVERYVIPGDSVPFITLRLTLADHP